MGKKHIHKTNAIRIIEQQHLTYRVYEYGWDEKENKPIYNEQDAGVPAERIYKTIVLHGDKTGYLVACIAIHKELNLKQVAKVSRNKRVELIPQEQLESLTGYIRGGCSPIGMKKQFPTYIEASVETVETVRVSAGKRGLQVELFPKDLIRMTKATTFSNEE